MAQATPQASDWQQEYEGDWDVFRIGGLLPPMWGVWKEVRSGRGQTHVGPLMKLGFRLEDRGDHVALIYLAPWGFLVDRLRLESDDVVDGVGTAFGRDYCRFGMRRLGRATK